MGASNCADTDAERSDILSYRTAHTGLHHIPRLLLPQGGDVHEQHFRWYGASAQSGLQQ